MDIQFIIAYEAIRDFMELGGEVLFLIAILCFVMWGLMLERVIYLFTAHRTSIEAAIKNWEARDERSSWYAHQIREKLISEVS